MPPRGVKSSKRGRQYEHIKSSAKKRGRSTKRAKKIAAATVNKQRSQAGQTKSSRKGSAKKATKGGSRKKTGGSRKTSSRKSSTRKTSSRKTSTRKTSSRKKR